MFVEKNYVVLNRVQYFYHKDYTSNYKVHNSEVQIDSQIASIQL